MEDSNKIAYVRGKEKQKFIEEWEKVCSRLKNSGRDLSKILISYVPSGTANKYDVGC